MGPVHREGDENIVNFEDKEHIKELEKIVDKAIDDTITKEKKETITNSEIMDALTRHINTFSLFVSEETVKGHAEANKENIALIKLTSIKKDTLCLNAKSLKMQVIHMALWVGVGLCLGLLDHVWLPHIDNMSGAIKEFIKWVIR